MNRLEELAERPLRDFVREVDEWGIREHGWLRWRLRRLWSRIRLRWYVWRRPPPWPVSQEAFDAVAADTETLAAIEAHEAALRARTTKGSSDE